MSETYRPGWDKPLDQSLYAPDEEEKAFMRATTGIQDDDALKEHILAVQAKAFAVRVCLCNPYTALSLDEVAVQVPVHPDV